ncbi:hypothetical protein EYC84_010114 [Monilinia fructicola]|uniref:Uncharacterized protein n=1 Tax=Monilinia fructicola TaxID=38448 RepID=A0A5M9JEF4_MONFR|nr:hypothetical protein EYC84_010114 [Monilinia fructicola]
MICETVLQPRDASPPGHLNTPGKCGTFVMICIVYDNALARPGFQDFYTLYIVHTVQYSTVCNLSHQISSPSDRPEEIQRYPQKERLCEIVGNSSETPTGWKRKKERLFLFLFLGGGGGCGGGGGGGGLMGDKAWKRGIDPCSYA